MANNDLQDFIAFMDRIRGCLMFNRMDVVKEPDLVGVLERGAAVADAHNEQKLAMRARLALVQSAYWSGEVDKSLVAFSWCLTNVDKNPLYEPFRGKIIAHYKWLVDMLPYFPQVSRSQIESTLDEMERRYIQASDSLGSVAQFRCTVASLMGDADKAAAHEKRWMSLERGSMSDCEACEASEHVRYLIRTGETEAAFVEAQPLLDGRLTCTTVPETTFSRLMIPAFINGKPELAAECHRRGVEEDFKERRYLVAQGEHLTYLALTGELARAVERFDSAIASAIETRTIYNRLRFYMGAHMVFRRISETGKTTVRLSLPKSFEPYRLDDTYETAELSRFFLAESARLAALFDRRNGNDLHERELRVLDQIAERAIEVQR